MRTTRMIINHYGGPEVMVLDTIDLPPPDPNEVQIRQTAIGLNFMDIYQRSGAYQIPLPSTLGLEAAGIITALGEGVHDFSVGDRVVYAGVLGAYASHRNITAARLIKIPDDIDDDVAAAVLMKGITVEYLLTRCYNVQPGQNVLFWAASGGVGQIAGQWGHHLGARMIGVTRGPANCNTIMSLGYDAAIDSHTEDVAARVREITDGHGVPVVYDSVGAASFDASINSLAPFGYFVSFGATTGPAPDVSPLLLQTTGSLYFTRPTLANYMAARGDLEQAASTTFALIRDGVLQVNINRHMPLSDVAAAHAAMAAGETTGSTVLIP